MEGLLQWTQAVLLEEDRLTLEGLGVVLAVSGERGDNIIQEYDSGTRVTLARPLRDARQTFPKISASILHCWPTAFGLPCLPAICFVSLGSHDLYISI